MEVVKDFFLTFSVFGDGQAIIGGYGRTECWRVSEFATKMNALVSEV